MEANDSASDSDEHFADLPSVTALRDHLRVEEGGVEDEHAPEVADFTLGCQSGAAYGQPPDWTPDVGVGPLLQEHLLDDNDDDCVQIPLASESQVTCSACGCMQAPWPAPPDITFGTNRKLQEAATLDDLPKKSAKRQRQIRRACSSCGTVVKEKVPARLWCSFYLRMKHSTFDLVPMVIGRAGCNVRRIAEETDTKVRVRGKGSGHLEFPSKKEAPAPLMVVVSTEGDNTEGFKQAVHLTVELLQTIEKRYRQHCITQNYDDDGPAFVMGPPLDRSRKTDRDDPGGRKTIDMRELLRDTLRSVSDAPLASWEYEGCREDTTEKVKFKHGNQVANREKQARRHQSSSTPTVDQDAHTQVLGHQERMATAHRLQQDVDAAYAGSYNPWALNGSGEMSQNDPWANYANAYYGGYAPEGAYDRLAHESAYETSHHLYYTDPRSAVSGFTPAAR